MNPENDESEKIDELAESIVNTVESQQTENDGLTERERKIEVKKEELRRKKAEELKKQLKKRGLGLVHYRWPAVVLAVSGILSLWTQFSQVMIHQPDIGFDSYLDAYLKTGSVFFLFPTIAGIFLFLSALWAYNDPRGTYLSIIPAMMMVMAGAMVYYLVSFALYVDPTVEVAATGTPLAMLLVGLLCLLAIFMREKE